MTASDQMAPAAEAAAVPPTALDEPSARPGRTHARRATLRHFAAVGKRLAPTGVTRAVGADVRSSWVWSEAPPSLRDVARGAKVTERIPGGAPQLRSGWVAWNYCVAVPMTAVLYGLAWIFQHPVRTMAAAIPALAVIAMWITG